MRLNIQSKNHKTFWDWKRRIYRRKRKESNTFVFDSGILYAVDTDGNALSGWPVDIGVGKPIKSVAFSDLNNDGTAEVIAVTDLSDILAYNLNGTSHEGFPMDDEFGFTASPMVMDMDGDGDLEILGGSEASLVAIDVKSSGSSSGYWNMYRGNPERTGYYDMEDGSECVESGDLNGDGSWNVLDIVSLANCILSSNCPDLENGCAADLNNDGVYNVLDIVNLVNLILDN